MSSKSSPHTPSFLSSCRTSSQSCWTRSEGCRSSPRLRRNEETPPYPLPFSPHLPSSCHASFFFLNSFLHQIMRYHSSASFVHHIWTSFIPKSISILPCTTLHLSVGGASPIISKEIANKDGGKIEVFSSSLFTLRASGSCFHSVFVFSWLISTF